jgi:hypothetical protein
MAVKRLSAEEVKAQISYANTLKAYFDVISKLVDAQVQASDYRIDRLTKDIEQEYKAAAVAQLAGAGDETARRKVLNDLAAKLGDNVATASKQKQNIADLVSKLTTKQKEMLEAYQHIVEAQQKLDEYIQLQKADEIAVNQLVSIVGLNKDKVTQSAADMGNIEGQIEKLFAAKEPSTP